MDLRKRKAMRRGAITCLSSACPSRGSGPDPPVGCRVVRARAKNAVVEGTWLLREHHRHSLFSSGHSASGWRVSPPHRRSKNETEACTCFKSLRSLRGVLLALLGPSCVTLEAERTVIPPVRPQTLLDAVGHGQCLRPIAAPRGPGAPVVLLPSRGGKEPVLPFGYSPLFTPTSK